MYKKIKQFCETKKLISENDKIIVGLSGGADSICLLLILCELKEELGFFLEAITINHKLRPEAEDEIKFVEELCKKMDIPLKVKAVDVQAYQKASHLGTEEAARILRYEIFDEEIQNGAKIALAHHRNDQAETVLFHMFRGSDIRGLRGMEAKRDAYIRPLLCVTREEIESYLHQKDQFFVTDHSNFDTVYSRNFIRHELLAKATEQICDKSVEHICELAESAGYAVDYLEQQTKALFDQYVEEKKDFYFRIKKEYLLQSHPYMRSSLVYEMLWRFCGKKKDISKVHVDSILELCHSQSGRKLDLIYDMKAFTDQTWLYVGSDTKKIQAEKYSFSLKTFPYEKGMEIPDELYTKWFDYDKISSSLCVRNRQTGDYFYCSEDRKQKLKDYFINEKISLLERDEIPLIADDHHILWIVGHRISSYYKITDQTKMVLEIQEENHGRQN